MALQEQHRAQSRAIIRKLANSLPAGSALRSTFLSEPIVSNMLRDSKALLSRARGL